MKINDFIMIIFYLHEKQTATVGKNSRLVEKKNLKYLIKWIKENRKHLKLLSIFCNNLYNKNSLKRENSLYIIKSLIFEATSAL